MFSCVENELGLRKFLESRGHTLVVTSDKDGPNSKFEKEIVDAEVVISQPFWPAYLTAARIAKAPKLKLALTAGVGSDQYVLWRALSCEFIGRPLTCAVLCLVDVCGVVWCVALIWLRLRNVVLRWLK